MDERDMCKSLLLTRCRFLECVYRRNGICVSFFIFVVKYSNNGGIVF